MQARVIDFGVKGPSSDEIFGGGASSAAPKTVVYVYAIRIPRSSEKRDQSFR